MLKNSENLITAGKKKTQTKCQTRVLCRLRTFDEKKGYDTRAKKLTTHGHGGGGAKWRQKLS